MRPRVLVVDDEAHVVHVVATKLHTAGIEVLTAMDGEEAIEVAGQHRPDLIITDYRMPLMNGLELCRRLREMESTSTIPVILLTAHGYYIPEAAADPDQIRDVVAKPFSPREILGKVRTLLAQNNDAHSASSGPQAAVG